MDVVWFGLGLPATTRFLQVYAIRLGADSTTLTWIASLPALVLLFSASISSWWMNKFDNSAKATFWPALAMRLQFLLPALTPFLPQSFQPTWLILSLTLPAIPQGLASVTFLVMFREAISEKQIPPLLGKRSLAMNICVGASGLAMGWWLEHIPFPYNYQAIFVVAFIVSMVSFWHVMRVRVVNGQDTALVSRPVEAKLESKKVNPWRSANFRTVAFVAAIIHIAYLSVAAFINLHMVKNLGATEAFIGGPFALAELGAGAIMALCTKSIVERIGNRSMIGLSMIGSAIGLMMIAAAPSLPLTIVASAITGASWTAAAVVGLFALFSEMTPSDNKAAYTTAYTQVVFLAAFIGPMVGKLLSNMGLSVIMILVIGAGLRLVAGVLTQSHTLQSVSRAARLALFPH